MKTKHLQNINNKLRVILKNNKLLYTLLFAFLLSLTNLLVNAEQSTLEKIEQIIQESPAKNAIWSISVRDTKGQTLLLLNAEQLVTPASNLKLITSAAVLDTLGPNYTFITRVLGKGNLLNGAWLGDVYVIGSGDPSINKLNKNKDGFLAFQELYKQISSHGINLIQGNLIGNDSYFTNEVLPKGWDWDDLTFYYAAESSALSFNNNCVDLEIMAQGSQGSTPNIQWFPLNTNYLSFINKQTITQKKTSFKEQYQRLLGTNTVLLENKIPQGSSAIQSVTVSNPSLFFVDSFRKFLKNKKIEISGQLQTNHQKLDCNESICTTLGEHISEPLSELLKEVNKKSNNLYAEMLLKAAASERFQQPGSSELGAKLMHEFADSMDLDTSQMFFQDASGLSSKNLVSTNALSKLLVKMQKHKYFQYYKDSLAIAGVDGTLEKRFKGSDLRGKLIGKTGLIASTRALSGYLSTQSGQTIIFSIITNHATIPHTELDQIQEKIVAQLYEDL